MNKQMLPLDREPVTILLVEDEPAHAEIARRNLAAFPAAHRIVHIEDGQVALDYLFGANPGPPPDLILLDLRLPRVDGLEVLRRIYEDDDMRKIPVVVLTTSSADSDLAIAFQLGARNYQIKPGNVEIYAKLLELDPCRSVIPAQPRTEPTEICPSILS